MITNVLQGVIDTFAGLLSVITSVLPQSPFRAISAIVIDNQNLAFLAWLVPFPQIIALLEAWGLAIVAYYIYMVIARWVKLLG